MTPSLVLIQIHLTRCSTLVTSYYTTHTAPLLRLLDPLHLTLSILFPPPRSLTPSRRCLCLLLLLFCLASMLSYMYRSFAVCCLLFDGRMDVWVIAAETYKNVGDGEGARKYTVCKWHIHGSFLLHPTYTYMSILTVSHLSLQSLCRSSPKNQKIAPRSRSRTHKKKKKNERNKKSYCDTISTIHLQQDKQRVWKMWKQSTSLESRLVLPSLFFPALFNGLAWKVRGPVLYCTLIFFFTGCFLFMAYFGLSTPSLFIIFSSFPFMHCYVLPALPYIHLYLCTACQ